MTEGKVLSLFVTMPDMMRSGHRIKCEDFDCDENGIVGSRDYDNGEIKPMVLVSKKAMTSSKMQNLFLKEGF